MCAYGYRPLPLASVLYQCMFCISRVGRDPNACPCQWSCTHARMARCNSVCSLRTSNPGILRRPGSFSEAPLRFRDSLLCNRCFWLPQCLGLLLSKTLDDTIALCYLFNDPIITETDFVLLRNVLQTGSRQPSRALIVDHQAYKSYTSAAWTLLMVKRSHKQYGARFPI
ncbi:hypothetical protein EDD18DRAFT_1138112 [Armillaria luteobubalina]|uniref:Uncharacterized protein n=1 Tax=Armillaria luteobubalina TaxID=153913 RepID=A0AA39QJH3_9AGAR|nr:hypothetical protein EDD18DRAFT_1138112 [Armillaria luteobubalina]